MISSGMVQVNIDNIPKQSDSCAKRNVKLFLDTLVR
jgi:hypothetical protein